MSLTLLRLKGFSEIYGNDGFGILVLTTEDETRQLSIVCDDKMLYQFGLRGLAYHPFKKESEKEKLRERCRQLLPEVLWELVSRHVDIMFEVRITGLRNGEWQAFLYNVSLQQAIRMRASDAILLSEIAGIPVYMDTVLMLRNSVPYDERAQRLSVPISLITSEMLQQAMDKAVEEEDYERASLLRDELKRRASDAQKEHTGNDSEDKNNAWQ